ncbi:MAG: NAD(P)/FAD-dependent oxidoreductase, partial [Thermoproteota archaeon]|nr:NAD(P)/FAD-dependent oxidoreductase [Thermoproteota archaeon]
MTAANLLRKNLSLEHQIVVVDKRKFFMMGLVNLWILSGIRRLEDSQIALNKLENKEITFLNDEVTTIDISKKFIKTRSNNKLEYDYLIIALGAELAAEEIDGFI